VDTKRERDKIQIAEMTFLRDVNGLRLQEHIKSKMKKKPEIEIGSK
jgi:hypothetical protein